MLILPILLLPAHAQNLEAQGVMDLPDKAVVNQFGDNQLLEFRPNEDGSPRDYLVYGLTRQAATPGEELKPLQGNRLVATAVQVIPLRTDRIETATIEYQQERVAYLRVRFTVSVQDGELRRSQGGQERVIASVRPGINVTVGYGLAWVATGGLIGIFAWPNNTAELYHDEVVPLNSAPITFTVGGGGGCLAFRGAHDQITVYPNQLRAGRLYELEVGLRCGGLFQGNESYVGQRTHELVGFRIFIDGQRLPDPFVGRGSSASFEIGQTTGPTGSLYWNVPDPNYTRRVGLIDRGVYPTRNVSTQPSVPLYFRYDAMYMETRGPAGEGEEYFQGFRPVHYAEHPELGRVLIAQRAPTLTNAPNLRFYRVLEGPAGDLAGPISTSIQLNDMSIPVTSLTWDTVATAAPDGTTATRQVPVYGLGSSTTYNLPDLRLQTLGDCEIRRDYSEGTSYWVCNAGGNWYTFYP
jgi:hypothetical protein